MDGQIEHRYQENKEEDQQGERIIEKIRNNCPRRIIENLNKQKNSNENVKRNKRRTHTTRREVQKTYSEGKKRQYAQGNKLEQPEYENNKMHK